MNDFKQLRIAAEHAKAKIYKQEQITKAELETLQKYAQKDPTPANLSAFAVGKRNVIEDSEGSKGE